MLWYLHLIRNLVTDDKIPFLAKLIQFPSKVMINVTMGVLGNIRIKITHNEHIWGGVSELMTRESSLAKYG